MNKRILLLDGSGTQALPIAKALSECGYILYSLCAEKYSYGYYTRYVKYKQLIPAISEEALKNYIIEYTIRHSIDVLIPLSDRTAKILSLYKEELTQFCHFVSPNYNAFINGFDKNRLMGICKKLGVAHPISIDLENYDVHDLDRMVFPAIIKPNITTGARGMMIVNNKDEFLRFYPNIRKLYGSCHLQRYFPKDSRQIEAQFYISKQGELIDSSLLCKYRYYPVKAGSSSCSVSLERRDDIIEQCYKVLTYIGWRGFASFDMIEDPIDLSVNITEINPRFPANIAVVQAAGANYGKLLLDDIYGYPSSFKSYRSNQILRHLGLDILWFLSSEDRWKIYPCWFKFWGKDTRYQDLSFTDPLPFLFGTYGNLLKQLNPSFRRQKEAIR